MRKFSPEFEIQRKPEDKLEAQVQAADDVLMDQHISPDSEGKALLSMSAEELKDRFPRRYQIYLELLRDRKKETSQVDGEKLDEMSKWLYVLNSLDRYIQEHHQGTEQTLRPRQINVFEDLRDFTVRGGTQGYIKLPTGVGKTVLFTEFIVRNTTGFICFFSLL